MIGLLIIYLVVTHELDSSEVFSLVERFEADLCRWFGRECERTRQGVQIMSPNGHQGSLPAYKTGTEQDCNGPLRIFNKIGLACLCYLHCFHPSDMFGISTFKVQLLSRPAYVLMEFLLQLNEAVISLLREGDVSQHCCHSVGSHCGCLQTAKKKNILIKFVLVFLPTIMIMK